MALCAQIQPHLAGTEPDPEPMVAGLLDQCDDLGVADRPLRGLPVAGLVVAGWGDLASMLRQHGADRLDPEHLPVLVDEGD
jgi:hypothetical protein